MVLTNLHSNVMGRFKRVRRTWVARGDGLKTVVTRRYSRPSGYFELSTIICITQHISLVAYLTFQFVATFVVVCKVWKSVHVWVLHTCILPAMKMTHMGRGMGGGDLAWVAGLAQHVVVGACILYVDFVIYVSYEMSLCHSACVCRPHVCTCPSTIAT